MFSFSFRLYPAPALSFTILFQNCNILFESQVVMRSICALPKHILSLNKLIYMPCSQCASDSCSLNLVQPISNARSIFIIIIQTEIEIETNAYRYALEIK